jgi:lipopolysaccharide/colanic/teichoic acid biosynthesis glycosyltransferase
MPAYLKIQLALKRVLDLLSALTGLVLISPILILIAAAIKIESPRYPLFFNDFVVGRKGRRFRMFKYRTMVPHEIDYESRPEIRPGNPLVGRVGRILRRLKLDELPQLWNVLRGDMSLVGPRPMDPVRFARSSEFQKQRSIMRPGLSGWAQVNGNTYWSWDERIEMDLWYIDNWSLWLDLAIMWKTVSVLLFGEQPKDQVAAKRITDTNYKVAWPGQKLFGFGNRREVDAKFETNKG